MKRLVRLAIVFTIVELVFSACGAPLEHVAWLHPILPWVDGALYCLLGLLLMMATPRWPLIITTAAAVAFIDATVGGSLGYIFGAGPRTAEGFIRFFGPNLAIYPVKSVLWALGGAAAGWPLRRIDNPEAGV